MGFLKKLRWSFLGASLILVALGVICLVNPGFIAQVICYVAGALLLAYGVLKVVRYFASRTALVDSLVMGVLMGMIGFILITRSQEVISLIFVFVGILILLDGVVKLKNTIEVRAAGSKDWIALLIAAIIVIAFGILIIANPFEGVNIPIIILGIALIVDSIQNLYAALRVLWFSGSRNTAVYMKKSVEIKEYSVDSEDE